jgi:hypothetical protein
MTEPKTKQLGGNACGSVNKGILYDYVQSSYQTSRTSSHVAYEFDWLESHT